MLAQLIECWNRHDVPAYTSFWIEDCDFVNVLGMHHRDRASLRAELEWLHGGRFRSSRLRDLGHSVRFLSSDLAIVHMNWQMDGDPGMPGHPSDNGVRGGVFTHVAQNRAGDWKIIASQNTDAQPIGMVTAGPTA